MTTPNTIHVWHGNPKLEHTGTWSTTRYPVESTKYIRADIARPMTVAEAAKVRETDDEAEVMRRLIEGERIFYSQDGKAAWLSDADRAHVSYRVVWALRNQGYLTRVSSEGGRVFCDEASDSLRALSQGGE